MYFLDVSVLIWPVFGFFVECNCSLSGSLSPDCNNGGACACKANVDGAKCNMCKPGFFNLQASDPHGCKGAG
jgi:hypothetical protein